MATAHPHPPRDLAPPMATRPEDHVPEQTRVIGAATSWPGAVLCAALSHRWSAGPWSRWAFGWDRELTCHRCGQMRHERARPRAELQDENDIRPREATPGGGSGARIF